MTDFIDSKICKSRENCMNCRSSQGMRDSWKARYNVPDDFDEECLHGLTMEQIKKGHIPMTKNPPIPPIGKRLLNFADSIKQIAKGLAAGRNPVAPDEVIEARTAICESNVCGYFNEEKRKCAECGCMFNRKLPLAEMECGVGLWGKYVDDSN